MKIGNREIGSGLPPYIVAEIGANHGGSLEKCLATMEAAKQAGADAVKLQAYTAETITLNCNGDNFWIKDGPWAGKRLWDLYKKCETPFEWFPVIAARAEQLGITWFASVFDKSSVDMLEKLECPTYKIASFEIVDLPLIRYAARTRKPIIISTGMASQLEILDAFTAYYQAAPTLKMPLLLHCVSAYPAKPSNYDLGSLQRTCGNWFGVSDHTLGLEVPIAATALGACMIEKHFKLEDYDNLIGSEDDAFSLEPKAFAEMIRAIHNTWSAMQPSESKSEDVHRPYRRSLFAVESVKQGETFTHENVRSIRPGNGLPPAMIDEIIGKKAARDVKRGEPMAMEMFDASPRSPIKDVTSYSDKHI